MKNLQEQKLRAFIRKGIIKKKKERLQETIANVNRNLKLRKIIKNIVLKEATDVNTDTPNRSTGINVLATVLKLVIPIIKQGYEQLTTSPEQRKSYRAHVIQNAINTLMRVDMTSGAEEGQRTGESAQTVELPENPELEASFEEEVVEEPLAEQEEEDIEISVGDEDEDKFIDVEEDSIEEEEPAPEMAADVAKQVAGEKDFIKIGGLDNTGMEMAQRTFPKVQKQIADGYAMLSLKDDKEDYADFLIANLKMYFDQFDQAEDVQLQEPTSPEYERARSSTEKFAAGAPGATLGEGIKVLKVLKKLLPNHEYFKRSSE